MIRPTRPITRSECTDSRPHVAATLAIVVVAWIGLGGCGASSSGGNGETVSAFARTTKAAGSGLPAVRRVHELDADIPRKVAASNQRRVKFATCLSQHGASSLQLRAAEAKCHKTVGGALFHRLEIESSDRADRDGTR